MIGVFKSLYSEVFLLNAHFILFDFLTMLPIILMMTKTCWVDAGDGSSDGVRFNLINGVKILDRFDLYQMINPCKFTLNGQIGLVVDLKSKLFRLKEI